MSTFEIVRGVEGDCLVLDDTRICGPKPWGGGRIVKTFHTDGIYEVIYKDEYRKMMAENAKLRELCKEWYRYARELFDEFVGEPEADEDFMTLEERLCELGVDG